MLSFNEIDLMTQENTVDFKILDNLSTPEILLFLSLYRLNKSAEKHKLKGEYLKMAKNKLLKEFEINSFNCKCWKNENERKEKATEYVLKAKKDKSFETAKKALNIIYNVKEF